MYKKTKDGLMKRRYFLQASSMGLLLAVLNPIKALEQQNRQWNKTELKNHLLKRKSYAAYQTTQFQGHLKARVIEGVIPKYIQGKLLKIGPGTKDFAATSFNHFFDGDAYLSEFKIEDGEVHTRALFLPSPHRTEEQKNQKMLYHEFGTLSPHSKNLGRKNQPNINFFFWDNSFLALSEGAHPVAFSPDQYKLRGDYNFQGALPKNVSFSAHPKFDPETKDGYGFGIVQGLSKALAVFKLEHKTQTLKEIYRLNQKSVYMIHDMIMTKNYLIFVIPPAYFKITDILIGKKPMANALEFDQKEKTRILILPKDTTKKMFECELPTSLVFHHGNAYETESGITFQSFLAKDASLLEMINQWQNPNLPKASLPDLHEIKINLATKKVESIRTILKSHDFPVFNHLFTTKPNRYIYASSMQNSNDPMAFDGITKVDLNDSSTQFYKMKDDEMCSEVFFIPDQFEYEDSGTIAYLGYNQTQHESFVEFVEAQTMTFVARAWLGTHIPLGFHGHFISLQDQRA
jgi:all-trans-8'-apo-beta-carotenal 15,15'-oxygenase